MPDACKFRLDNLEICNIIFQALLDDYSKLKQIQQLATARS